MPSTGRLVSNVVMMGMGEPLYNFDNVKDALQIAADGEGIGLSKRRITLSTSGVVPMIPRAGDEIGVMLAISLHAVRDELRDELVPLNKKYPIAELLAACRAYPGLSNARRITFEYVMLKGVNDTLADARELVAAARRHSGEDQPDPVQSVAGQRTTSAPTGSQIERFADVVNRAGYASPIRTPRGRDILAACGQLKSESERMHIRERMALEAMIAGLGRTLPALLRLLFLVPLAYIVAVIAGGWRARCRHPAGHRLAARRRARSTRLSSRVLACGSAPIAAASRSVCRRRRRDHGLALAVLLARRRLGTGATSLQCAAWHRCHGVDRSSSCWLWSTART